MTREVKWANRGQQTLILFYSQRTKITHEVARIPVIDMHDIVPKPKANEDAAGMELYLIRPTRKALATACVRLTVSSFLVALFR